MRFRILLSYAYYRTPNLDAAIAKWFPNRHPEVFADSGAFSAMSQGQPVDLAEYAEWLKCWRHHFAVYANLDVIGDGATAADQTWANQLYLEDQGLSPLPVFHAGEPWSALDRLLEAGYGYIGLGGLVGRPQGSFMSWLVRCFQLAEGRAAFHGFGLTSWQVISALPFYSVDSTSWGTGFIYGRLRLFDPTKGRFVIKQLNDHALYDADVARLIRSYGFDPADFAIKERYSRQRTCQLSACSWQAAEAYLRTRHGAVVVPGDRRRPEGLLAYASASHMPELGWGDEGLRWYCSSTALVNLQDGAEGLRLYLANTNLHDFAFADAMTRREDDR